LIYLVEDDRSIRELVVYTLESTGFEARGFENGAVFWEALRERPPRLAILDLMLPGEDGFAILRRIRAWPPTRKLPVMMLSAKGAEYDKVLGLNLGADDYLAKPVGMMELSARVKSLLRRAGMESAGEEFSLGPLYVNVLRRLAAVDGEELCLTLKEFDLLVYLVENAGAALSRDKILSAVWGYEAEAESRTVDTHILTLRSKLGKAAFLIRTVRGVGYKAEES
jgi:two-component system alkaline phosphatase synthesis response regulator PhoP